MILFFSETPTSEEFSWHVLPGPLLFVLIFHNDIHSLGCADFHGYFTDIS